MELSVKERIIFPGLYPKRSSLVEQTLVRDINLKVSLTQEEMDRINLKLDGSNLKWDEAGIPVKKVDFTRAELDFLKSLVERLDKEKQIDLSSLPLCLKIKDTEAAKEK